MNRTSASPNSRNRSTKSGFMSRSTLQAPELATETPGLERTLRLRDLLPIGKVLAIGVGRRRETADCHPAGPLGRAISPVGHRRILPTRVTSAEHDSSPDARDQWWRNRPSRLSPHLLADGREARPHFFP